MSKSSHRLSPSGHTSSEQDELLTPSRTDQKRNTAGVGPGMLEPRSGLASGAGVQGATQAETRSAYGGLDSILAKAEGSPVHVIQRKVLKDTDTRDLEEEEKKGQKKPEGEPVKIAQAKVLKDTDTRDLEEEEKKGQKKPEGEPVRIAQAHLLKDTDSKDLEEEEKKGQKKPEGEPVQLKRDADGSEAAGSETAPSGGESLPGDVRAHMEQSLGADFSGVRIHEDGKAKALNAQAYAEGNNLHFAPGHYNPDTEVGASLLGHELTHVVQQKDGRVSAPQKKGLSVVNDSALEHEADVKGAKAAKSLHSRT